MAAKAAIKKNPEDQYEYDQYGFYIQVTKIKQDQSNQKDLKKVNARVEKWRNMIPQLD